jgi:hypothetical protein
VGAVEDPDLPPHRALLVDAPQEVVGQLGGRRRLEGGHPGARRGHPVEHDADRAVLAGGVGALQHQQDAAGVLGVEALLEPLDDGGALRQQLEGADVLVGGHAVGVAGGAPGQVGGLAGRDDEGLDHRQTLPTGAGAGRGQPAR